MTDTEAAKLVTVAVAACSTQGGKMSDKQIRDMAAAWAMLLEDITYADGSAALKRWLATSHWLPAPSQLRAIVSESKHGRRRPGADAWGDVGALLSRFSTYRFPTQNDVADPIVWRCIDALGWRDYCLTTDETVMSYRARFIELYDRLAASDAEDRSVASLPGVARPALPERTGATQIGAALLRALPTPEKPNA